MTKERFLRRLRFALRGGFTREERRDIIADYEGFFIQGQAGGLSEAGVAEELGDPAAIARNLARESGKPMPAGALLLGYSGRISFFLGLLLFFGAGRLYLSAEVKSDTVLYAAFSVFGGLLSLAVMATALYLILKGKMAGPDFRRGAKGLLFANAILFALAAFCSLFFNSKAGMDFAFWVIENVRPRPRWFINGIEEIRKVCLILSAGIGLKAVYRVWRGRAEAFVTAVHALGLCLYLEFLHKIFSNLSSTIESFYRLMAMSVAVYGAAAAMALLSAAGLRRRQKGAVTDER